MTRWKLRIAGGLALCSLLAVSPPSSRAGWRTKAEKRPKAAPADCEFGYYGTNWRAWPEGCKGWTGCANSAVPYAVPLAPSANSYPQPAMPLSPTWPAPSWNAPNSASPMPPPVSPSPWSTYREFLPPQTTAPTHAVPQKASPQIGVPLNSSPPQFAPPIFPPPNDVPRLPPGLPTPTLPTPQASPPVPNSSPAPQPPTPQSSRNLVPPLPTTKTSLNSNGVQPASAAIRMNAASSVVTLGAPQADALGPRLPKIDRTAPLPSFSSVPKSLIAPKDVTLSPPARNQNPVTLLSIE